ncbi:hypothetical protein [Bacillus sp. JJ1562]|uniref:hypothetical protein n=1 Tax=Bacillus sp. JJ1562 TaxID=3122960 RepID=UPI0030025094
MKKGYIKTPREIRFCKQCAKQFETFITSAKKYCSQSCAGKVAIKRATIHYVERRQIIHHDIKDYIIRWTIDNNEIVSRAPFNKIKTTISPLLINIQTEFGVKDFRVISKAVFGEDRGRKELLRFMKSLCN